jgi:hypothetical protein
MDEKIRIRIKDIFLNDFWLREMGEEKEPIDSHWRGSFKRKKKSK